MGTFLEELKARAELESGAQPSSPPLEATLGAKHPLGAFSILAGGDAFEMAQGTPPPQGPARASAYAEAKLRFALHAGGKADEERVKKDIIRLISGSLELMGRLEVAKPIDIELIPAGKPFSKYGYPKSSPLTIGLFWDDAGWARARIGLRQEKLSEVPQLAIHEMAHAVHHLAFTKKERELIDRTLLRTFGTQAAIAEAFAIYTEREFLAAFSADDKRAPGVYGFARQRWSEDHVFTRFVRNLYFPYRPLAGPKMAGFGAGLVF